MDSQKRPEIRIRIINLSGTHRREAKRYVDDGYRYIYIIICISIIAICNIAIAGRQLAHAYACTIIINITNNTALAALIKP